MVKLKNLGARVLSIALVLAMVTQFAPLARAAEPVPPPKEANASDSALTGKPRLYIDFLGGDKNNKETLPTVLDKAPTDKTWRYTNAEEEKNTLFWVGVGIDKMDALALKDGSFSLELGFYYNSEFVEPYTGAADETYKETLQTANINNATHGHDWSSDYKIIAAETNLAPTTEPVTQEAIADPSTEDILKPGTEGAPNPWRMTYVSLEKTEDVGVVASNRFRTNGEKAPTQYVLLIPFRYKSYDTAQKLCFRLVRNSATFTMGAGSYGFSDYGAWERVTTNPPGRNLKLMLDFDGDLNIFTGDKQQDKKYEATLSIKNGGSATNNATLRVTGDEAPESTRPIVGGDGAILSGLTEGTGVTIDLTCRNGFNAVVTVTTGGDPGTEVAVTTVTKNKEYAFHMPGGDVKVTVTFEPDTTGNIPFDITLTEAGTPEDWKGNAAELVTNPPSADPKKASATAGSTVTVKVACRADYYAQVVATGINGDGVQTSSTSQGAKTEETTANEKKVWTTTLPKGGSATFQMPAVDVAVAVTYVKAPIYQANLSVGYPTEGTPPTASEKDLAQLSYPGLDKDNQLVTGYSSIVSSTKTDAPGILGDATVPPTVTGNTVPFVKTPAGQTVTVTMSHDPNHQIKSVIVTPENSPAEEIPAPVITPKAVTGDKLTATFQQPEYAVNVAVVYEDRPTSVLTLLLTGASTNAGNRVTATGTGAGGVKVEADTGAATPTTTITVFEKTQVTAVISRATGFTIGAVTLKDSGGTDYYPAATVTTDPTTGARTVKFNMPAPDLTLAVNYTEREDPTYTATLETVTGGSSANTARWRPAGTESVTSFANVPHVADAIVAEGYYISAVVARSDAGNSYPVTTNGNGYNNGLGGTVELGMTMPAEDVTVTVTFSQGPPPVEPLFGATLAVLDPDNVKEIQDDNYAQLSYVNGTGAQVKKDQSDTLAGIRAGDLVTLNLTAVGDYYVADVVVTPANLHVAVEWTSPTQVVFTMPAGNVGVAVTFRDKTKLPPVGHNLTVAWQDASNQENKVLTAASAIMTPPHQIVTNGEIIKNAAAPGDTVTLGIQVAPGFRVAQVTVLADGALVPVTLLDDGYQESGSAKTVTGSFVMQGAPATATVIYAAGPAVPDGGYFAGLTVLDPNNVDGTADNWAQLSVSGKTTPSTKKDGVEFLAGVAAGDLAMLTWHAEPGYVLDALLVTPVGLAIVPTMTGPESAEFTMPAESAMVRVRFRAAAEPPKYTANLTLRGPDGAGSASFAPGGGYSITAAAGTAINVDILADAGYYIESFVVTSANLNVKTTLSGIFAAQTGSFIMPAADCMVNVTLASGWPDSVDYRASLRVVNPDGNSGNTALIHNRSAERPQSDSALVTGRADDVMELTFQAAKGYLAEIHLTDPAGREVLYVRTGESVVGFRMPASHVAAEVRYTKAPTPAAPALSLAVADAAADDTATLTGGAVTLTAPGKTTATPGSTITLTAVPGTGRYVKAVLAMAGGELLAVNAGGTFVMPERDVCVTVYFAEGTPPVGDLAEYAAALTVTGPRGSAIGAAGQAKIQAVEPPVTTAITVATAPLATGPSAVAESNSDPVYISVAKATRVQVAAIPQGSFQVEDIRLTPIGSSLSVSVKFDWINRNTVEFSMPEQPVAVEVLLSSAEPAYSAQVLVNDDAYTGAPGTSKNAAVISDGTATAMQGERLENLSLGAPVDVNLTIAAGYAAEVSVVTASGSGTPLSVDADAAIQTAKFGMPAADVIVYVKFVRVADINYSATLRIVSDKTTTQANVVLSAILSDGTTSTVNTSGASIGNLVGRETLNVSATTTGVGQENTEVAAVLMTTKTGATYVPPNGEIYTGTMPKEDVVVTVVLVEKGSTLYVAAMNKAGDDGKVGNSLTSIKNLTSIGLPGESQGWTAAYAKDVVEVAFTTEPGYYATVKAVDKTTGTELTVLQQGVTLSGKARFAMPADDVQVTVTYSTKAPTATYPINLVFSGHAQSADNKVVLKSKGTSTPAELASLAGGGGTDADLRVTVSAVVIGTSLGLDAIMATNYRVKSAVLSAGTGDSLISMDVPLTAVDASTSAGGFYMPSAEATLTVTYKSGYSATLVMADNATGKDSKAKMEAEGKTTIEVGDTTKTATMDQLLTGVVTTTTPTAGQGAALRGVLLTKGSGTAFMAEDSGALGAYPYTIESEDVTVTTVFDDSDGTAYIAAVEMTGDFAQEGNGASIVNTTAETNKSEVQKGDIWTMATTGEMLTVTIALAEGYIAQIEAWTLAETPEEVRVVPIAAGADGATAKLTMPEKVSVRVIVKFTKGESTPRPYDPEHSTDAAKGAGWLLAENNNDNVSVTVTVPVLAKETAAEGGGITTTYENVYVAASAADEQPPVKEFKVAYAFYIEPTTAPGTYKRLVAGKDYKISAAIPGHYYEADKRLTGERFVLTALSKELLELVAGGGALYITATVDDPEAPRPESAKTFLEVPEISLWAKPHDPERTGAAVKDTIGSVNNGGVITVTIPTLMDAKGDLGSVPAEVATDIVTGAKTEFRFNFYLNSKPGEAFDEANCIELVWGDTDSAKNNVIISPVDPDQTGGNYTYGDYYTDGAVSYEGVKFYLKAVDPTSAIGLILNNLGSEQSGHSLYVKAVADITESGSTTALTRESEFVPLIVPQYYTLSGALTSYAPTHEATLSLYPLDPLTVGDGSLPEHYAADPILTQTLKEQAGTGLWSQEFGFSSSLLEVGKPYLLVVGKPSHITYRHTNIVLDTPQADGYTYALTSPITLLMGDVDGDGLVKLSDRDWLDLVVAGAFPWDERCDLDGDGKINFQDQDIWQYYGSLNASEADYGNPHGLGWVPAPVKQADEPVPEDPVTAPDPAPEEPAKPIEPAPVEPPSVEPTPVEPIPPDALLPEPPALPVPEEPLLPPDKKPEGENPEP